MCKGNGTEEIPWYEQPKIEITEENKHNHQCCGCNGEHCCSEE